MSANPPAKRRRHDTPSAALSKPFKSPLRKPPSQPTPSPEKPSTPSTSTTTNPATTNEPKEPEPEPHPENSPTTPSIPDPKPPQTPPSSNPTPKFRKPNTPQDPTLVTLQKTHRTLQSNLSTLRSNLDTLTQAHRLETSSKDTELEALIGKWRGVAQDAAEEVFGGARERVARMGGMKGYKERIRVRAVEERRWEVEEREGWFGAGGNRSDEEAEEGAGNVVKLEEKKEEEDGKEEEEEEEEFTMETMLKTLNIEPKIIGFDSAGQRWVK